MLLRPLTQKINEMERAFGKPQTDFEKQLLKGDVDRSRFYTLSNKIVVISFVVMLIVLAVYFW